MDARSAISGTVPDARSIEAIKTLLLGAKRPVIVAGGGVKSGRGWDAVVGLARTLALPIAASAGHADVVPNDYPLIAGQVGPRGNPAASRLTREADVILALGTRLASHDLSTPITILQRGRRSFRWMPIRSRWDVTSRSRLALR